MSCETKTSVTQRANGPGQETHLPRALPVKMPVLVSAGVGLIKWGIGFLGEQGERKRSLFHIQEGFPVTALLPIFSCWVWSRDGLLEKRNLVFHTTSPSRWHLAQ